MGIFVRKEDETTGAQILPFDAHRPLRASAQRVKLNDRSDVEQLRRRAEIVWQRRAWEYFDAIGEVSFAFSLMSNVTSRCRLYPAFVVDRHQPPVEVTHLTSDVEPTDAAAVPDDFVKACVAAFDRVHSSTGGVSAMLRDAALNLCVAGECYLVQVPERVGSGEPETWDIRSVDEVQVGPSGTVRLKPRIDSRQTEFIELPQTAFVGRIWRNHPRYSQMAESSMLGVLQPCEDLLLFGQAARATARSRLNSGAMFIPDGLSAAAMPAELSELEPGESLPPDEDHDEFEEELIAAMTTPIADEDSASAVVPLIIRGPAELGKAIQIFKFERAFDPALAERADRALDRIMQGIDVPKDVVSGLANVKYTNALVIDKALYKAHVEPLLLLICDALTVVYFRQMLLAMGQPEELVKRATVWYDPADVVIMANPEELADSGYEKYLISAAAWRRSHGFTEDDRPSSEELAKRVIVERGQVSPDLTEAVLQQLGPTLFNLVKQAHEQQTGTSLPPEVQQALGQPPSQAPVPGPPTSGPPDTTQPETSPGAPESPPAAPEAVPTGAPA